MTKPSPVVEQCCHWIERPEMGPTRCNVPAIVIVWGKLSEPEDLGPACNDHLPEWVAEAMVRKQLVGCAVFDLRGLCRG